MSEAAVKIAWLVREGLARGVTGVALKDERATERSQLVSNRHMQRLRA